MINGLRYVYNERKYIKTHYAANGIMCKFYNISKYLSNILFSNSAISFTKSV